MQKAWKKQKQILTKNITLLQQQVNRHKALNLNLLKKSSHKRTCSQQQTFIFNQTNISSYYPLLPGKNEGLGKSQVQNWVIRANLRSHLDSVRALLWQGRFLISAGEDCLLKIWDREKLRMTVRQHLAPIFTICGDKQNVFTAGAEGVIRQWSVEGFLQNNRPVAEGEFHDDTIWELIWNSNKKLLASSSSEGYIRLIRSQEQGMKEVGQIWLSNQIPTSICFVGNERLVSGLVESKKLSIFDMQTRKKISDFPYCPKQNLHQSNKLVYSCHNLIFSAHEDKNIRVFDLNSNKVIKNFVAHSDSVTSLSLSRRYGQNQIVSCSHDGTLRIWDIRQWKCIFDVGVCMRKYDQSLLCLGYCEDEQMLAVGGADGQIKLLCPQI